MNSPVVKLPVIKPLDADLLIVKPLIMNLPIMKPLDVEPVDVEPLVLEPPAENVVEDRNIDLTVSLLYFHGNIKQLLFRSRNLREFRKSLFCQKFNIPRTSLVL